MDVRDWLWHLTLNTGEVKKCERHYFTDWQWAQFEQAGLLPGPVEITLIPQGVRIGLVLLK